MSHTHENTVEVAAQSPTAVTDQKKPEGPPAPRMAGGPSVRSATGNRSGGLGLGLLRLGGRDRTGGLVELLARVLHRPEGDDLALEEHAEGPVGEDADLAVP